MQELTSTNFKEVTGKGTVIVDVWAPWCGPCKMFGPIFEETSKNHPHTTFVKLNSDDHGDVAQALGIRGIPTVIFFKDGQEVGRSTGAMMRPQFEAKIKEVFG